MQQETLFELPEELTPKPIAPTCVENARVRRPVRNQIEWIERDLDSMLSEGHPARSIWMFLEKLDLSAFYTSIKAVLDRPGRPQTDPQVLLGLWILATAEGVSSARKLGQLCEVHDAYRWLCGGVPVNYHMLSDFRVAHQRELDDLLTRILAAMMSQGLVTLRHTAQDGMRVRASAGASSFRRQGRLEKFLEEAKEQITRLKKEREAPGPEVSRKQEAARVRAARERLERIEKALQEMPEVAAVKERQKKRAAKKNRDKIGEPRVSTTDPEARVMKMADAGFRPAYNLQIAADVDNQVIVGVDATMEGNDGGLAAPMVEQIEKRTGSKPGAYLMDGGFVKLEDITTLEKQNIDVYAPTPSSRKEEGTQSTPRKGDTPEVTNWRQRMETEEAKKIYRERAATAEPVNARGRAHGLVQFVVRGREKVLSVLLLAAITHNLLRWIVLTRQPVTFAN